MTITYQKSKSSVPKFAKTFTTLLLFAENSDTIDMTLSYKLTIQLLNLSAWYLRYALKWYGQIKIYTCEFVNTRYVCTLCY